MKIGRRGLFKAFGAAPFLRLPEVPCHEQELLEGGEFCVVHLKAARERDVPVVEIEVWNSDLRKCGVCGENFFVHWKVRVPFSVGEGRLLVPPDVQWHQEVIVPVQTTCRMWVDGEPVDWLSFETSSNHTGTTHKTALMK